jgi:DNA mismatch endonuclease (patch repair protein)
MTDIVSPEKRSQMMSGIRGSGTKIEVVLRKALFARGFRYRVNDRKLPGKPDLVLPKYRSVIFMHGCFWHGHDCNLFRLPESNRVFWETKIGRNRIKDELVLEQLSIQGWRVMTIWECAIRGRGKIGLEGVADSTARWLVYRDVDSVIKGKI